MKKESLVERESIGCRIKRVRKSYGWTLDDVQRKSGVSKVTLSAVERGADVRLSTLVAIENALGIQIMDVVL